MGRCWICSARGCGGAGTFPATPGRGIGRRAKRWPRRSGRAVAGGGSGAVRERDEFAGSAAASAALGRTFLDGAGERAPRGGAHGQLGAVGVLRVADSDSPTEVGHLDALAVATAATALAPPCILKAQLVHAAPPLASSLRGKGRH